jgi:hypothetical protein
MRRYQSDGKPEYRTPLTIPGTALVPIGLFIYGWGAQYGVHWIVPNIGSFFFGAGVLICFNCAQAYIVDAYSSHAASAGAAVAFLRTLAGFGFPLFADPMYQALGYGWGNSLLAFIAIGFGLPSSIGLWMYGSKLRSMSQYCAG